MSLYTEGGYLERNPTWHEEHSGWKADHIVSILRDNALTPRSIAEVGCGMGQILVELAERLPSVAQLAGFEISPQAFTRARTKTTERISYANIDVIAAPPAERFDIVMAIDVFEHVDDYIGFIRGLNNVGRYKIFHVPLELAVSTMLRPVAIARARTEVGHIHYFTRETALATLEHAGLKIIDERFTDLAIDLADTARTKLASIPRRAVAAISKPFAAQLLGGFSLLVLAE
ncbi:MAG: class I SAM-dependent methyltransferase [Sphingomonadaceae bacterium]